MSKVTKDKLYAQLYARLYDHIRGTKYDCLSDIPEKEFAIIKNCIIEILNEFEEKIKKTPNLIGPPIEYERSVVATTHKSLCTDESIPSSL